MIRKILVTIAMLVFAFTICAHAESTGWYKAEDGSWHIRNQAGEIVHSWIIDDTKPQTLYYFINPEGKMVETGIVQDSKGNYYALNQNHNGSFGSVIWQSGTYDGITLNPQGSYIVNEEEIRTLIDRYGLTQINTKNALTMYMSELDNLPQLLDKNQEFVTKILNETNRIREQAGVRPLTLDDDLQKCAKIRCEEACHKFNHERPDGRMADSILTDNGLPQHSYGENLAKGHKTPEAVMQGWCASPGHYANIIDGRFSKIGISVYKAAGTLYYECLFQ